MQIAPIAGARTNTVTPVTAGLWAGVAATLPGVPAPFALPATPAAPSAPAEPAKKAKPDVVGAITDKRLPEVSGLAASATRPDTWWVHNDSGDGPRIFAISSKGEVRDEVHIDGAHAFDWEDIAVGPGREAGTSAVYVADTGDNLGIRRHATIYRVPEPAPGVTHAAAEAIDISYPDGKPHNIETMMVDPRSGDLFLVTKVKDGPAKVFRGARELLNAGGGTLEQVGTLDLSPLATAGDISADGSHIVVRTYSKIYVWNRAAGTSVADALRAAPTVLGNPELAPGGDQPAGHGLQLEAIGFSRDSGSLFTVGEGEGASIFQYAVPA